MPADGTHHCTRVFQILPDILSRETGHTQSGSDESSCYFVLLKSGLQRLRASFVDSVLAAFNRKRSCRGPNWDSAPEHVERKPKGMKSSSRCMNAHIKSVVPPTPQARHGCMCEDRTTERTWHPNAKAETQDRNQQEVCQLKRKLRLSS